MLLKFAVLCMTRSDLVFSPRKASTLRPVRCSLVADSVLPEQCPQRTGLAVPLAQNERLLPAFVAACSLSAVVRACDPLRATPAFQRLVQALRTTAVCNLKRNLFRQGDRDQAFDVGTAACLACVLIAQGQALHRTSDSGCKVRHRFARNHVI